MARPKPFWTLESESDRRTGWPDGAMVYCKDTLKTYKLVNGSYFEISFGTPPSASWGNIGGTITAQTDLNNVLNSKASSSHGHNLNDLSEKSYNSLTNKPTIPNDFDDLIDGSVYRVYTTVEKNKLSGVSEGAEVNVNADWNASTGDAQIINKPSSFPPSSHSHPPSDVTGTAVITTDSRLSDARTPLVHNQAISTITDLQTTLDGKLDDTQLSGLTKITVGTNQPASPDTGDLWIDTN